MVKVIYSDLNPLSVYKNAYKAEMQQEYDDIVDDSNFRRDSEKIRDMLVSGTVGSIEKGLYDYQEDEKITKDNVVSDIEIAIRSGQLDKADVQKLKEALDSKIVADKQEADDKQLLEAERQAQKNRTKALDKQLGVNQDSHE